MLFFSSGFPLYLAAANYKRPQGRWSHLVLCKLLPTSFVPLNFDGLNHLLYELAAMQAIPSIQNLISILPRVFANVSGFSEYVLVNRKNLSI